MVLASTCARWAEAVSKASGEGQEAAGARVHLVSTLARRSVPSPSTATLAARLRAPAAPSMEAIFRHVGGRGQVAQD